MHETHCSEQDSESGDRVENTSSSFWGSIVTTSGYFVGTLLVLLLVFGFVTCYYSATF